VVTVDNSREETFLPQDLHLKSDHYKVLFLILSLTVLRLWILPLRSSLWLDETVTYWAACKGIAAAVARSQFLPGQQFLYIMLTAFVMRIGGSSEIVLRLPSVIATGLTAWLVFRLGKTLFDSETGILAVVVFASLHIIAKEAAVNARPYSIGLLLVVGATLELVEWLRSGRTRAMLAFVLLSAGIAYLQILFTVVYLVFLLYAVYMRWSGKGLVSWKKLLTSSVLISLLLLPLLWNLVHAKRVSAEMSFATVPDATQLLSSFLTPVLGASLLAGLLIGVFLCKGCGASLSGLSRSTGVLLIAWLTVPVFIMYVVARLTLFEVFVPRYFLTAVPALALLIAWMVRSLNPARARIIIAATVAAAAVITFPGGLLHPTAPVKEEDWRSAAALVKAAGISESTPVLVRVGLIDTAKITWDLNIGRDSPLLSPISKYSFPGRIILLPYRLDPAAVNYLSEVYDRVLRPVDRFVVVARTGDTASMIPWLRGWFLAQGFVSSQMGNAEGIAVLRFSRQASR
jgi:uncharacterized membrane protein